MYTHMHKHVHEREKQGERSERMFTKLLMVATYGGTEFSFFISDF